MTEQGTRLTVEEIDAFERGASYTDMFRAKLCAAARAWVETLQFIERLKNSDSFYLDEIAVNEALRAEVERLKCTVPTQSMLRARIVELEAAIERIGRASNTDPFRTFDGMIQDMQMIDDIARGALSPPTAEDK
jgi:hypothetical protein